MKERIFLILFGTLMGGLSLFGLWPLVSPMLSSTPSGSEFESIEDFHRAMLARDERDARSEDSVSLRSIITPHLDRKIMYDLLPHTKVRFQRAQTNINGCGMRGPERKVDSADSVFRIALLGDSFAFGWGVEYQQSFAAQLEVILSELLSVQVEVLNFGVPGYSTFQQVALFEERGRDFSPDAVLVFFIENDFGLPFFFRNVEESGSLVSAREFASQLNKQDDQELLGESIHDLIDPNRSIERLVELGLADGFETFVAINPRPDWKKDLGRLPVLRKGLPGLNHLGMRKQFMRLYRQRGIKEQELSLSFDPHPSPIKHRLLAEVLAAGIFPYLSDLAELRFS